MIRTIVETNHLLIDIDTYEIGFEFVVRPKKGIRLRLLIFVICIA